MTDQTQTTTEPVLLPCPFCGGEADRMAAMGESWVRCMTCNAATEMFGTDTAAIAAWNRRPALSPPAEVLGMAANKVGAWIARRDSEYEAALADLTQPPCIDSLDDFGRTIYSALEDCPAMSVDKQADFIARAFWPLIATPTPAPAEVPFAAEDACLACNSPAQVDWQRVGPKLVEALERIKANDPNDPAQPWNVARAALAAAQPEGK